MDCEIKEYFGIINLNTRIFRTILNLSNSMGFKILTTKLLHIRGNLFHIWRVYELEHEDKIILYMTDSGKVAVSVRFEDENFWMTQKAIAELFETERSVITKHLSNIYEEDELDKDTTCAKFAQVQIEGRREVSRLVDFYNLDAIIAVI